MSMRGPHLNRVDRDVDSVEAPRRPQNLRKSAPPEHAKIARDVTSRFYDVLKSGSRNRTTLHNAVLIELANNRLDELGQNIPLPIGLPDPETGVMMPVTFEQVERIRRIAALATLKPVPASTSPEDTQFLIETLARLGEAYRVLWNQRRPRSTTPRR